MHHRAKRFARAPRLSCAVVVRWRTLFAALPLVTLASLGASLIARRTTTRALAPPAAPAAPPRPATDASLPYAPLPSAGGDGGAPSQSAWMLHGGPDHLHRARGRGPRAAHVAWTAEVGGPVVSQVVAAPDGRSLYVATLAGELVCLSTKGDELWRASLEGRAYGTPLVDADGNVYVGSDARSFFSFDAHGRERFRVRVDGECDTSAALDARGRVVVAAGRSVVAVRPDGTVAWRFVARGKVFSSPAISKRGLVVFGSQDGMVRALDADGKVVFCTDLGSDVDATAAVDDDAIFIGDDAGEVVRLRHDGSIVWRSRVGGFVRGALSVSRSGDVLAGVYGPTPRVVRLDRQGAVAGSFALPGTGSPLFGVHGAPLEDDAHTLYFGAQDDFLHALGADGGELFRVKAGGDVDGPATLLADGTLVFASEDGRVYALGP